MKNTTNNMHVAKTRTAKLITLFAGIILITVFNSFSATASNDPGDGKEPKRNGIKTIVLDPGHGGNHPGAIGKLSREKEVALQIALKLGKRLEEELGINVIYTRKTNDVNPALYERPALANKHHADLFISIHLNSFRRTAATGTETFVLGFGNLESQDVAMRENAAILMEENYEENYGGFDPNDPSTYIVFQLMKRQYREQSIRLASYMQAEFAKSGRPNRGVKEAPFAVLKTAGMPAVLTEVGFISNPSEEKYMMSAQGQKQIVDQLFNAINTYRKNIEK